jgi:hypothetical protein
LKKASASQKIKTVFMLINGKINSGVRTKQFKIRATYKPSLGNIQNFVKYDKSYANAKTGSFGIHT